MKFSRLCEDDEENEAIERLLYYCPNLSKESLRAMGEHKTYDLSVHSFTDPFVIYNFVNRL